jgi:hypothetical protein
MSAEAKVYHHPCICTTGGVVRVGEEYDYKEGAAVLRVRCMAAHSDSASISFNFEISRGASDGHAFHCWAASMTGFIDGLWRVYDKGTYL